jgi:hypothetical protein
MAENESSELRSLRWATLILAVLSMGVFLMQRFVVMVFNLAFEICIFYLSTLLSLAIYLWKRRSIRHNLS